MQQEILIITYYQIQICQKIQLTFSSKSREKSSLRYTKYTQKTFYSDDKCATNRGHLSENPIKKIQNLYGIAPEQNVDQTVHQLRVALAVGTVYFTIALSLIVKTESCYQYYLLTPDSLCNYWKDLNDYQKNLIILKTN